MMSEDVVSLIDPEPPDRYRFDYKGMHRYLITLPVYASKKIFTNQRIVVAVLNSLRDAAMEKHFDVYAYCLLPDQMVMIARGRNEDSDMKAFLAEFRSRSSKVLEQDLGHPLWKKKYLERVLRKRENTKQIAGTIFQMPVKAGICPTAEEYPFQGSFAVIPEQRRA